MKHPQFERLQWFSWWSKYMSFLKFLFWSKFLENILSGRGKKIVVIIFACKMPKIGSLFQLIRIKRPKDSFFMWFNVNYDDLFLSFCSAFIQTNLKVNWSSGHEIELWKKLEENWKRLVTMHLRTAGCCKVLEPPE